MRLFTSAPSEFRFELSPIKAMELSAAKRPGTISLAQGIPSFDTPAIIRDFIKEKMDAGLCDRYSLTIGLSELREELSLSLNRDGLNYDPDSEIIVTAGSIEAISASIMSATEPGDEVLIPSPTYASYLGSLHMARCTPKFVWLDEDNNFDFQVEEIERNITRRTKAMLYCSPNNPTGTLYSEEKTRKIVDLALQHNLTLIIDEVYKDFYYTDDRHFTPASIPEARNHVVRICSFSKAFAMTGWRVGFVHSAAPKIAQILKYHDAMVTCAPVASQYGAIAALRFGEPYLNAFKAEFRKRRALTINRLDAMAHVLDYQTPNATYFVFPRIKDTVPLAKNSHALAYDILDKVGVALVPGSAFGPAGESHLRISYGRELPDLEAGLSRLADYFAGRTNRSNSVETTTQSGSPRVHNPSPLRRRLIAKILALSARAHLSRNKPLIVGIVGTTGKTVVKRSVADLLKRRFRTRANILSYNTEIGLPLSILELTPPRTLGEKFLFPLKLLARSLSSGDQSEILVLEYGVLSAADANNLLKIAKPDWLVISSAAVTDPSIDHAAALEGLRRVIGAVQTERILWPENDTFVQALGKFKPELGLAAEKVTSDTLFIGSEKLKHNRECVTHHARLGLCSAVILAQKLGINREVIGSYLNERNSSPDPTN